MPYSDELNNCKQIFGNKHGYGYCCYISTCGSKVLQTFSGHQGQHYLGKYSLLQDNGIWIILIEKFSQIGHDGSHYDSSKVKVCGSDKQEAIKSLADIVSVKRRHTEGDFDAEEMKAAIISAMNSH